MWRSTYIDETTIELTYAVGPQIDDASTLVIARMPLQAEEPHSIAYNRLVALRMAREIIGEEIKRLTPIVDRLG